MSGITPRTKALSIVPHITGAMSMAGSAFIAHEVYSDREKRVKTYHRIMFAISLCDIVSSFAYFLSTWPLPQGPNHGWNAPYHFGAAGNEATCTAQGVLIQFGVVNAFYNAALSLHYLLVVRYHISEAMVRKMEPLILWMPPLLALALTVPGIFLKIYHNSNIWCWIAPNWKECGDDREGCIEEANAYRFIFYFGPLWASVLTVVVMQFLLWLTVKGIERRLRRHNFRRSSIRLSELSELPNDSLGELIKISRREMRMQRKRHYKRSRQVAMQSLLYVLSFFVTWFPYTLITAIGLSTSIWFTPHTNTFYLLLAIVICQPWQGFLNFLVYNKSQVRHHCQNLWRRIQGALDKVPEIRLDSMGITRGSLSRRLSQKSSTGSEIYPEFGVQ